jgi:hypothetical protein
VSPPPGPRLGAASALVVGNEGFNAHRMSDLKSRELYRSSNGDTWHLCEENGRVFVLHRANLPSGGEVSRVELADFLARGNGPEQQALLALTRTLLERG